MAGWSSVSLGSQNIHRSSGTNAGRRGVASRSVTNGPSEAVRAGADCPVGCCGVPVDVAAVTGDSCVAWS